MSAIGFYLTAETVKAVENQWFPNLSHDAQTAGSGVLKEGMYLTLEQGRGVVQKIEGLGQRQWETGGCLTTVEEYDL